MNPHMPPDDQSFPRLEALLDTLTLITEQVRDRDVDIASPSANVYV